MGNKIILGENTIFDTDKDLFSMLFNKSDGYRLSEHSGKKVDWICPNCHSIVRQKQISKVKDRGLSCSNCGDGVSRPNKIMRSILNQLGIEFIQEKRFIWSEGKIYDFYIPSENTIIEVDGIQHKSGIGFGRLNGIYPDKQIRIDDRKKSIALSNGILHYIQIDASTVSAKSIVSEVEKQEWFLRYNTSKIDIKKCEVDAANSLVFQCALLWNNGSGSSEISELLSISVGSVIKYLKRSADIGVSDYSPYTARIRSIEKNRRHRAVICKNYNIQFKTIHEAANFANTSPSNIQQCCNGIYKTSGNKNGERLMWAYLEVP